MLPTFRYSELEALARELGLILLGVAKPEQLLADAERLTTWQAAGHAGEMKYMQRDAELLSSPKRLLPSVRSIPVFAAFYDSTPIKDFPSGYGRVARYAWGRDYHQVIRERLAQLCARVQQKVGVAFESRFFTDSVPLLERALARSSGAGFIGKNSMLILPKQGSFFFIAEVLWNIEVAFDDTVFQISAEQKSSCGSCTRCLEICPTGALVSDKILDAKRCTSYLTIEKRGWLTDQERSWVGDWLFGCDLCQECCPFNHTPIKIGQRASISDLQSSLQKHGVLDLRAVLALRTNKEYQTHFEDSALMRTKREGLLRNAAVVAANTEAVELISTLLECCTVDSSDVVRGHALWSAAKLANLVGSEQQGKVHCAAERIINSTESSNLELLNEAKRILDGTLWL